MLWLKQSTAVTINIGPFLDDTDGKTAETGLTIAQADVRLAKNGGDMSQKNEASSCTHFAIGVYGCVIDVTDTATLGRLQLWVHEAGALPVWHEYMVVPANVWDSLFGADKLQTDMTQCGGSATPAGAIPNAAADGVGGLPISDAGGLDLDAKLANTNEVTAARMGALTDWINDGRLDSLLDAIPTTAMRGTDSAALASAYTAARAVYLDELAAANIPADVDTLKTCCTKVDTATDGLADKVADEVYEGTLTLRQIVRIMLAVLAGKSSGGGTATIKFRDEADAKDRVTATVEADGDRTAMTLDGT